MGSGSSNPKPSSGATEQGEQKAEADERSSTQRRTRAGGELWFGTLVGSHHMIRH